MGSLNTNGLAGGLKRSSFKGKIFRDIKGYDKRAETVPQEWNGAKMGWEHPESDLNFYRAGAIESEL